MLITASFQQDRQPANPSPQWPIYRPSPACESSFLSRVAAEYSSPIPRWRPWEAASFRLPRTACVPALHSKKRAAWMRRCSTICADRDPMGGVAGRWTGRQEEAESGSSNRHGLLDLLSVED